MVSSYRGCWKQSSDRWTDLFGLSSWSRGWPLARGCGWARGWPGHSGPCLADPVPWGLERMAAPHPGDDLGGWRGCWLLVPGRTWEAGLRLQPREVGGLCGDSLPLHPPRSSVPSAALPPPPWGAPLQPPLWMDDGGRSPRPRSGWRAAMSFHRCILGTCLPGRGRALRGHETRPPAPSGASERGAQGDLPAGPPPPDPET